MCEDLTPLEEKIKRLKEKRKAIILAHNYQLGEVQKIADYLGDSLELSRIAAQSQAEVIVFCGVHFMAETASILCPQKKILLPDINAGCPLADMITPGGLLALKEEHPGAKVVSYINTSAAVKAASDICCTSANAIKVVQSMKNEEIIFIPDKYLASYVSFETQRNLIAWDGYCPVHVKILSQHIRQQKALHPRARVIVHPECTPEVIALADEVLSTGGMCRQAQVSKEKEFIVGTEIGILCRLRKENPEKIFYPASEAAICPNMKRINLEKVLWALEEMKEEVKVAEEIRIRAGHAVQAMLEIK